MSVVYQNPAVGYVATQPAVHQEHEWPKHCGQTVCLYKRLNKQLSDLRTSKYCLEYILGNETRNVV